MGSFARSGNDPSRTKAQKKRGKRKAAVERGASAATERIPSEYTPSDYRKESPAVKDRTKDASTQLVEQFATDQHLDDKANLLYII